MKGRVSQGALLPDDAPTWKRHVHGDGYGYRWLLVVILCSLAFQMAAPDTEAARLVIILIQGFTLVAALVVSGVRRWLIRFVAAITAIAIATAVGIVIGAGELDESGGRVLGFLLAALAPAAILIGIVRQARRAQAITLRTMFGVLCVYLLIGSAFAYAYGLVSAMEDGGFFDQVTDATQSDFLYFSFATITTTGFGDLTAATDLGRSLAVTEALLGQIYLVTVVALIVGNLGRPTVHSER
jgi:Ion channel